MENVCRPTVERLMVYIVPRLAFPVAEVDLAQPLVDSGLRIKRFSQSPRAT